MSEYIHFVMLGSCLSFSPCAAAAVFYYLKAFSSDLLLADCGTVVQRLALSPHNKKIHALNWSLHILSVLVRISCRDSGLIRQISGMYAGLISNSKLAMDLRQIECLKCLA